MKEGVQPVIIEISIKEKTIKALVDSGADKNYIHWKLAKKLGIQL